MQRNEKTTDSALRAASDPPLSAPAAAAQPARDKPWIFRTYAGHSTAAASNALYRTNLGKGQTGLSVAFDLPTQTGYDSDHPLVKGEVGVCLRGELGARFLQIAADAVKHTIDELHRLGAGELARDLNSLVDDDCAWSLRVTQEFGDRAAQDIAINGSHSLHAPVLRMTFDQLIDIGGAIGRGAEKVVGESANVLAYLLAFRPEGAAHIIGPLSAHVSLEKHLEAKFAGFTPGTHGRMVVGPWSLAFELE